MNMLPSPDDDALRPTRGWLERALLASGPRTELILVRHGMQRRTREEELRPLGPRLSAHGARQAAAVADYLAEQQISALYCSDITRAHDTARAIAERYPDALEPEAWPDLREIDIYGESGDRILPPKCRLGPARTSTGPDAGTPSRTPRAARTSVNAWSRRSAPSPTSTPMSESSSSVTAAPSAPCWPRSSVSKKTCGSTPHTPASPGYCGVMHAGRCGRSTKPHISPRNCAPSEGPVRAGAYAARTGESETAHGIAHRAGDGVRCRVEIQAGRHVWHGWTTGAETFDRSRQLTEHRFGHLCDHFGTRAGEGVRVVNHEGTPGFETNSLTGSRSRRRGVARRPHRGHERPGARGDR